MPEPHARIVSGRGRAIGFAVIIGAAALVVLAAHSARAFHIDDAIYIRWAREITAHWPDPYCGEINWFGTSEPIPAAMRNPPLGAMLLALVGSVAGWSERSLHLALLVPSAAFLAATWALARRWTASPNVALAIAASAPAFLVTSASIMADTLTAAACTCAILAWCRPLPRAGPRSTVLAALALFIAAMTKWYGLTLVPLLVAWELLIEKRLTLRCAWLLVPLAAAAALERWTGSAHGVSIFTHALSITLDSSNGRGTFLHAWSGLAFLGGSCAGCLLLIPFLARSRARALIVALALACIAVLFARGHLDAWPTLAGASDSQRWAIAIQLGVWGFSGLMLLLIVLQDAWRGTPEARLLALWIAGTTVFCLCFNWGFPVRSFLPIVPALAISMARACEQVPFLCRPLGRTLLVLALLGGGILATSILRADSEVAEEARETATALVRAQAPARVWFEGHWGFQHYAEAVGARALDREHPAAQAGDVILVPMLNTNIFGVRPDRVRTLERRVVPLRSRFVVLGPRSGAGFWADALGPLPFAWNLGDAAETWVFEQR